MDLAQLQELVAHGESETLEFKKTTGERRSAMESICAMLNHRGGRVLFGVNKNGTILGQQVADRTIEEVAGEIQRIEPNVFPQVDRIDVTPDMQVISVVVGPGSNRPYSFRGQAYKRVGNTNAKMSREEYNRILVEGIHGERRWETEPATGWGTEDDISELTKTVDEAVRRGRMDEPGTREPTELLRGFGLYCDENLLRAAVVLFGKQARIEAELPQGMLRVAKFRGTDKTEFVDNRQFHGNTFALMAIAERYLRENLPIAGRIVPGLFERVDEPLYPPEALREALANAFCHRDYSIGGGSVALAIYQDRLEITSSGALHFGLTAEKLYEPHESLPWNPLIARVFHRRGLIESWGRGTLKIAELTERAGLPRPDIEEGAGFVVVRFMPSRYIPPRQVTRDLSDRQREILAILASKPTGLALRDIRAMLQSAGEEWEVKNDLAALKTMGMAHSTGHGRGAKWIIDNS